MRMLTRRLQVLLDERQYARLAAYALDRKLSVGAAVREAIDKAIPGAAPERRAAARRLLAAPAMPVPDPDELREGLDELRARRA
jgi:hypothetical protein